MRWSTLLIPTLRQAPVEAASASHALLLRAGFMRQKGAGAIVYLPLGQRSLLKIRGLIREEMERVGGQEFLFPENPPSSLLEAQKRKGEASGKGVGKHQHHKTDHAWTFLEIARNELRSYRNLPQTWYQFQTSSFSERRMRSGLLPVSRSTVKVSCSLDLDRSGLAQSYKAHGTAYERILDRCGLLRHVFKASANVLGSLRSEDLVVITDKGEYRVVKCSNCDYASRRDTGTSSLEQVNDQPADTGISEIHTPRQKTIRDVSKFLNVPQSQLIKSLVYLIKDELYLLLLRGDHQLSDAKLSQLLGTDLFRPGLPEEIEEVFQADPGSLGPVGLTGIPILADLALKDRRNMICGANKDDFHLVNVSPGQDFSTDYEDIREVVEGDLCTFCDHPLGVERAVRLASLSQLQSDWVHSVTVKVSDQTGAQISPRMGSYEIQVEGILGTIAELFHDKLGLVWPLDVAPFQVVLTLLSPDDEDQIKAAEDYARRLDGQGVDCLIDDRSGSPGLKFKDAELIGFPIRITLGRAFGQGQVEIFVRSSKEKLTVNADSVIETVQEVLREYPLP